MRTKGSMGYYLRLFEATLLVLSGSLLLRTNAQTNCYLNVGFVVDGSGGVCQSDPNYSDASDSTCSHWQNILNFVQQIVQQFTIGPNNIEVAVEYFSDFGTVVIPFSATTDKTALLNAIASIPYKKYGNTYYDQGLTVAANQLFNASISRQDATNALIMVTDGPDPSNQQTFQNAINLVASKGIKTYAVGIGDGVSDSTLQQIVHTSPQLNVNYFHASDFNSLNPIAPSLTSQLCVGVTQGTLPPTTTTAAPPPTSTPTTSSARPTPGPPISTPSTTTTVPPQGPTTQNPANLCSTLVDLFYLLDISGSICDNDPNFVYSRDNTCNNWKSITGFVANMTSRLNIGPNNVRVGLATFGDYATLNWGLSQYSDSPSLLQAINNLQYFKGQVTNTSGGLYLVDNQFVNTARPGAAKICIIKKKKVPTATLR